jgi:hypothetical protein
MGALRRSAALATAAAGACLVLAAGVLAGTSTASAADPTVPVTVTLIDTAGDPVAGYAIFSYAGPSDDEGTDSRTDASGTVVLQVPPYTTVLLGIWIARDTPGGPEASEITVDSGATGAATTILVPPRMTHSYRVVDPQGRPVHNAFVGSPVLVSSVVSDPVRGDYRMTGSRWLIDRPGYEGGDYPGETGYDGVTDPVTVWQPEPDPAVACAIWTTDSWRDPDVCDSDHDGVPDGLQISLRSFPELTHVVPYDQWIALGSGQITLQVPAVPVIEVVGQRRGTRAGEAVLTVRAREPRGTGWAPAVRQELQLGLVWPYFWVNREFLRPKPAHPKRYPHVRTDDQGLATIHLRNFSRPTSVSVTVKDKSTAAATVTVTPKRGILIGRTQHTLVGAGSRSRASLKAEYVTLINTADRPVRLRGWTVTTHAGKRYTFGRYTLRPGAQVTLHSGRGTNTRTDRYWGSRRPLWGSSDTAALRRPSGTVAASCHWWYNTGGNYEQGTYVPEGTARCVV